MLIHYPVTPAYSVVVPAGQVRRIKSWEVCPSGITDLDASRGRRRLPNFVWQDMENEDIPGLLHNRSRRAIRISVWCND